MVPASRRPWIERFRSWRRARAVVSSCYLVHTTYLFWCHYCTSCITIHLIIIDSIVPFITGPNIDGNWIPSSSIPSQNSNMSPMYSADASDGRSILFHPWSARLHVIFVSGISNVPQQSVQPSDLEGAIILPFSSVFRLHGELWQ